MDISTYSRSSPTMQPTTTAINNDIRIEETPGTTAVVINIFFTFIGTFGNFLVIFAVLKTPQLRQRPSNNLILSLAIADLVVTMVAQPLFATKIYLKAIAYRCNRGVDMAYVITVALSGGSSMSHLAAISIDRALATSKPHKHSRIMKRWSKVMLSLCWGTASIATISGYFHLQNTKAGEIIGFILVIFDVTLVCMNFVLMIASYAIILYTIKFPKFQPVIGSAHRAARERATEKRVSGTIAIVIFLFVACWFPVVGYRLSQPPTTYCALNPTLMWIRTVYLTNSSMNFIVYSLRIRQFRAAYLGIINRMLQPLRKVGESRNMNVAPNTTAPAVLSIIYTANTSSETKDTIETIQIESI